jgi:hypothetical protein
VVTRVNGDKDAEFPVGVDKGAPTDMMVKLVVDRFDHPLEAGESLWCKLRTFELVPGTLAAPTRVITLNTALVGSIVVAVKAVREAVEDACDDIVAGTPQSRVCSSPESDADLAHVQLPSTPTNEASATADNGGPSATSPAKATNEVSSQRSVIM